MFKPDYFVKLSREVGIAIKQCKYPDYRIAALSSKSFDVVVSSKDKKYEGKGYRAFLNSIFAFTLMTRINLIEFIKGLNGGRYGFLQDPQPAKILM